MAKRGRPRKVGDLVHKQRRHAAVMPGTLDRLNRFKVRLAEQVEKPLSQDDALNVLLDLADAVDTQAVTE